MKVYLVGFMGCGKSSIGKMLARELGYTFVDMDKRLSEREGRSVNEIFAHYGENHFRKLEADFLREIAETHEENLIIATGGGVACKEENLEVMLQSGVVVYLAGQHSRPLIQNKTPQQIAEFIDTTLTIREPYYSRANIVVDCDHIGDSAAISVIRMALEMGYYK